MDLLALLQTGLEKIPYLIGILRGFLENILSMLNLPSGANTLVFLSISILLAYFYIKQFISSGWGKLSNILNLILLAIIFYLLIIGA
jgi:hypothetical protein